MAVVTISYDTTWPASGSLFRFLVEKLLEESDPNSWVYEELNIASNYDRINMPRFSESEIKEFFAAHQKYPSG